MVKREREKERKSERGSVCERESERARERKWNKRKPNQGQDPKKETNFVVIGILRVIKIHEIHSQKK